jgi:hypothetical protein
LRVIFKIFKILPAIYLAESGKFQIYMINSLVSLHWAEICRWTIGSREQRRVGTAGLRWEDRAQRQDGAANREGKIISIAETKSGRKGKATTSVSVLKNEAKKLNLIKSSLFD